MHNDDHDGSCYTIRFSNLVEGICSRSNTLNDCKILFSWDVRLEKDHGEMK